MTARAGRHVHDGGEERAQVIRWLNQLANHTDSLLACIETDVAVASFCLWCLLENRRSWDDGVARLSLFFTVCRAVRSQLPSRLSGMSHLSIWPSVFEAAPTKIQPPYFKPYTVEVEFFKMESDPVLSKTVSGFPQTDR